MTPINPQTDKVEVPALEVRNLVMRFQVGGGTRPKHLHALSDVSFSLNRAEVLALDKSECQRCRELKHRYKHAVLVHHVKHLRDRPDLALSIWDGDERQLVSVCKQCHEELHPESFTQFLPKEPPITAERWD